MKLQMLSESRAGAGNTLMKKQCVLVHETERDEFGKAARLFLNLTKEEELIYPMRGGFVHQNTLLFHQGIARSGPTLAEHLKIHALSRILLAGAINNVQVSWVKLNRQLSQRSEE